MRCLIFIFCFIYSLPSSCQLWQELGQGLNSGPFIAYTDTVDDILYIGGGFAEIDGKQALGIAKWDGVNWNALAGGIEDILGTSYPHPPRAILRYKDYIYIGGMFQAAGGFYSKHLIRWDGVQFDSIPFPNEAVFGIKIIDNELVICGTFDTVGNLPIKGIANWNGSNWYDKYNFPDFQFFSRLIDIALYKGELYACGNFHNNLIDDFQNIVKWNGQNWEAVGKGIRGMAVFANSMVVYKDELYVAGEFRKRDGNAGNNIQKWNGSEWLEVGGGLDEYGQVRKLFVNKGKLYAVGGFEFAGGIEAQNIAIWNGIEWCGLGSKFDNVINTLAFYNDTLIIGGGFWTIDGDSISYLAKWTGGDYVDTCGVITSVKTNISEKELKIYPNPFSGLFFIEFDSKSANSIVEVYNILGKKVYSSLVYEVGNVKAQIDISEFPEGVYFVSVFDGMRFYSRKIVNRK